MRIILLSLFLLASTLFANIGKITAIKGDVSLIRDSKSIKLSKGSIIEEKDKITTGKNSRLQLIFNDKTIISLGKNSVFDVEEYFYDANQPKKSKVSFKVAKGVFKSITGQIGKINPNKFKLKTKSANIGIRGTIFFGKIGPKGTESISCTQGSIVVATPMGSVNVGAGEMTRVEVGRPPLPPMPLSQEQRDVLQKDSGASANEQESGQGDAGAGAAGGEKEKSEGDKEEKKEGDKEEGDKEEGDKEEGDKKEGDKEESDKQESDKEEGGETKDDGGTKDEKADTEGDAPAEQEDEGGTKEGGDDQQGDAPAEQPAEGEGDTPPADAPPPPPEGEVPPPPPADVPPPPVVEVPTDVVDAIAQSAADVASDAIEEAIEAASSDDTSEIINDVVSGGSTTPTQVNTKTATYFSLHSADWRQEWIIENQSKAWIFGFNDKSSYKTRNGYTPSYEIANGVIIVDDQLTRFDWDGTENVGSEKSYSFTSDITDVPVSTSYTGFKLVDKSTGIYDDYDRYTKGIFAEGKKEFFVQIYKSETYFDTYGDKTSDETAAVSEFEYYRTRVYGERTPWSTVSGLTGISKYVEPDLSWTEGTLMPAYTSAYNNYTIFGTDGTYINWTNKNMLSYEINDNGLFLVMGNLADSGGYATANLSLYETSLDFSTKITSDANSVGYLFGSEYQGIGSTINVTQDVGDGTGTVYESVFTHGEFRVPGTLSATPTGSTTFTGFMNIPSSIGESINFIIDRDISAVDGDIQKITGTGIGSSISFGGELGTDSAYITDDTFAALNFSGSYEGYSVVDGWLIAVDTGSISSDGTSDDGITWGYWGVDASTEVVNIDTWVAGINRVADMATLATGGDATYTGKAMGYIHSSTPVAIDPSTSTISLTFDFGSESLSASLNANGGTFNHTKSFSTTLSGTTYTASDSVEMVTGSFYNGGAYTAGSFKFVNGDTATGVFKAKLTTNNLTGGTLGVP